ncbi:gliding motility-associated protein GldE [Flavobacterium sp.]|uniref:gliding motility-associated protein GldE n=1 Tax=Flavobacterium sp. TaxID=239 RepID=UPI0026394A6E|nr:gliding motility-associated protein GldE [Flavobacterium sp.]MDD3004681.1 gliding motility-associated protein GldE [Flavobacterium sp.]
MDIEPSSISFFYTLNIFAIVGWVILLVLLFFAALISGAEVAFFSLSQTDIEKANSINPRKTRIISDLLDRPKKLLATLLVANNVINISIVVLFLGLSKDFFNTIAFTGLGFLLKTALITFVILFFGEVLPKIYASRNNIKFAEKTVYFIAFLEKILSPISLPMRFLTLYLQKKLGKEKSNLSVDQLSQALELTSSEETPSDEQKILEGIVSFGNTETKQVMSPRIDIFALENNELFADVLKKVVEKGYSRVPVYKDNIDQIEGVLFVKDLIPHIDKTNFEWTTLLREPFFVPENKKLDNLLKDFQQMKRHLAIVVDEYGGTSGLVSLEDIIEEIVGDISDEFDDEDINFSQIDENNFLFEGKIYLKDFYRIIDVDEDVFEEHKGEAETLAGLLLEILGNFPKKGQQINFAKCTFTVEVVDKKRIKQIKVTLN